MKTTRFLVISLMAFGGAACKSRQEIGSGLRDASAESPLITEIKAAAKNAGCGGCHNGLEASEYKQWALDTKNTYERLTSQEADPDFDPTTFAIKGIYKAYPEYFKAKFTDDAKYEAFVEALLPDPGMKVRGTTPADKKARFDKLRDLMLKLAAEAAGESTIACTPKISDKLKAHIREMETQGWAAKLLTGDTGGTAFQGFGCQSDSVDPLRCFRDTEKFKARGDAIWKGDGAVNGARLVEVGNVGKTFYWTRSSPDGRWVGNGGSSEGAHIDDLQNKVRYYIGGKRYDPGFFPDNAGFTFHGNPALFCSMDVLNTTDTRNEAGTTTVGGVSWKTVNMDPTATHNANRCLSDNGRPTGTEDGPSSSISTYQSIGNGQGSKAWVVTGSHSTDIGSYRDDNVSFSGELKVYELKRANGTYERVSAEPTVFTLPNEGDYSLTPTSRYIVGRIGGSDGKQAGYRVRSLSDMMAKGTSFDPRGDDSMSSVCFKGSGSKPMASLDERFLTFHQYANQKADIFVIDLLGDGKVYQVTDVPAGTRALFPHFRADGWLYFLLASDSGGDALILGSDIAIKLADGQAASH